MGRRVSKPPCFKFLMAGMRLSLPSGPFTASMALTFYIRTLCIAPQLFLRATVRRDGRDGRRRTRCSPQAMVFVRAMVRTQGHCWRRQGARPEAAARNARAAGNGTRCYGRTGRQ
jgi:hypothetical protein